MSRIKYYEVDYYRFEFMIEGGALKGVLSTGFPELEPFTANIDLSKPRSRRGYSREAVEFWGMGSSEDLNKALTALCSRRTEEVQVAAARDEEETSEEAEVEVSQERIDELVGKPGVLSRLVESAARISGVVGERPTLKVVALSALSAQLALAPNGKPIATNLIITGSAGRGKNYLCDAIAPVMPPRFHLAFESSSSKAFYYMTKEDPHFFENRWVYPNEAEGVDLLVETMRPMLSGGRATHTTVNKDASGRNASDQFTIEGPISLTIPTVRNKLDSQLQSRMLIAGLEDYEGRIAAHTRSLSSLFSIEYADVDYSEEINAWQGALRSLTDRRRVVLPVNHGEFRFSSDGVPHGARLWSNVLGLMFTNAWLEQRNRRIISLWGGEEVILASPEDYGVAYEVFKAACERSVVNFSEAHRKILNAVYKLHEEFHNRTSQFWNEKAEDPRYEGSFSQNKISKKSGVPQSTISDNKTFLVKSVKLLQEEYGGGLSLAEGVVPADWEKGDALVGFPNPKQVESWWTEKNDLATPESPGGAGSSPTGGEERLEPGANGDRAATGQDDPEGGHRDDSRHSDDRDHDSVDRNLSGSEKGVDEGENATNDASTGATGPSEGAPDSSKNDARPPSGNEHGETDGESDESDDVDDWWD